MARTSHGGLTRHGPVLKIVQIATCHYWKAPEPLLSLHGGRVQIASVRGWQI